MPLFSIPFTYSTLIGKGNVSMRCKSILLNIDIDAPATSLIKFAVELAKRFEAKLIGCSSAEIVIPVTLGETDLIDREIIEQQRKAIQTRLSELQQKFIDLAGPGVEIEWRGEVANPTKFLTETARAADLIVTGSPEGADLADPFRSTDLGNLILNAGRPVLLAAGGAEHMPARKVLIAWKDCREARRAVADALPFLTGANEVVIATAERKGSESSMQSAADVAAYLSRHGVRAKIERITGKNDSDDLLKFARSIHADLIVSGAYGHSRLHEWVFGGVTVSLLDEIKISRFMSN
jgi:nucleotide-binding universal stress UspA family protein